MKFFTVACAALATGATAFVAPRRSILNSKTKTVPVYQPSTELHRDLFQPMMMIPNKIQEQDKRDAIDIGSSVGSTTTTSLQVSPGAVEPQEEKSIGIGTIGLMASIPIIFTSVCYQLQIHLNTPCLTGKELCTPEYHKFAEFFNAPEHATLAKALILTHAIPFLLIPLTMKFIYDKGDMIKADFPTFNPYVMQLGMATIAFGLALEFGWHVSDSWYYANEFHILNFGFYFFLISGFALWADGFDDTVPAADVVFGLILLAATALYPIGNELQVNPDYEVTPSFLAGLFENGGGTAKIPLYIGMTATFASITKRGIEVLGKQMWWVLFLSVGVNLAFIFVLAGYSYDPLSEDITQTTLNTQNYIFHICHDILGTEAGVAYFAYLIYSYTPVALRPSEAEE